MSKEYVKCLNPLDSEKRGFLAEQKNAEKAKAQSNIAELEKRLSALEAEKKELVDALQRLQAEFENYKKRVEKEKPQIAFFGKAKAVAEMLAVVDSFNAAEAKMKKEQKKDSGLEALHAQILQAMQRLGVREIHSLGTKFDHETMDCMMQGSDKSKADGIVLEELQKGFLLDGAVLRHAKVKVNKLAPTEEKKQEECAGKESCGENKQIDI